MPLPIAHSIAGYAFAAATGVRFRRDTWTAVLFSVVVANLPDLDFIPGTLADSPVLYHRTIAHTIPAAILCGLIIGAVLTRFGKRFWEISFLGAFVYGSHLFADMIHFGGSNIGIQVLWPLSDTWYAIRTPLSDTQSDLLLFNRGGDSKGFLASFFSFGFLRAMFFQTLLFTPLLIPAWWIRWKRSAASR
jgi:inner membrane protein